MRRILQGTALAALLFSACAGYIAWGGYGYCDPYYDPYCYDYYYGVWSPASLAVTDFDADGTLDLAVSGGDDGVVWFVPGAAGGGFAAVPSASLTLSVAPVALALANVDGDANPDLLVLDGDPGNLAAYAGDGHGGFTRLSPPAPLAVATLSVARFVRGSLDGDVFDDVVLLDPGGGLHVLRGTGTGGFDEVAQGDPASGFLGPDAGLRVRGVHLALAEFDAVPGSDLAVLDGERTALAFLSGHGDGTFGPPRTVRLRALGDALSVAPVTRRVGRPADLAVLFGDRDAPTAGSTLVVVQASDGALAFDPMEVESARALVPRDLDGDGITDLVLADAANGTIRTLHARRP